MADGGEAMAVSLRADFGQFEKALLKAQNQTDAKLNAIEKRFSRSQAKVKDEAKGLGGVFGDLQRSMGGVTAGLPGVGAGMGAVGIAGGVAAGGVLALLGAFRGLQDSARFAADLTDAADRIGVTVEALQELRYAADETGVPLNELEKGLEALNGSLGAFKTGIGAGRIKPIFEALGLTPADLATVENAEQLLPILADRLGQVSDRASQVQLARKLGIEALLPLLRSGGDGIRRLADEGRNLGLVLDNDVVKGLDETDRALEKNKQLIDANVRQLQSSMAPFFVWITGELARVGRGITDLFNGLDAVEKRSDRVLDNQITALEGRTRGAMIQSRNTRQPLTRVQEGWFQELGQLREEKKRRDRERAARPTPSAADRAREGGFELQAPAAPPGRRSGGGRAASGPSAEEIARQREMLLLQQDIELLRAQGRDLEARSKQMQLDSMELTARYEAAGVENAEARAKAHVAAVAAAENAARTITALREMGEAAALGLVELDERAARAAMERLAFEVEIARLSGDVTLPAKERGLWVEERINALLRERPSLSRDQARGMAESEYDGLRAAEIIGGLGMGSDPVAAREAAYAEIDALRQADRLSEEEAARAKLQADAAYWEARTSLMSQGLNELAGLQNSSNSKLAAIGKAAAIVQATRDGILAVQNALATGGPFPLNIASAAIIGGMTAANIAQIAGLRDGGPVTGIGGPRQDNQLRWLSVGEYVNNAASVRKNRPFLEAANRGVDLGRMIEATAASATAGPRQSVNLTFSPVIDARGSDVGVKRRIEAALAKQRETFKADVLAVVDRRDRFRIGKGRP